MVQYPSCILRFATPRGVSVLYRRFTLEGFSLKGYPPRTPISRLAWGIGSLQQAIPKLDSKETSMSSLSAKDRVSLCSFTFSDGRRCRTPRTGKNPRFCFYHAQKEARARATKKLGKDLAYFFSGDYLSACDLSTALGRLIPAVVRGDVKPKTAHTVAYLAQTLMQAIHLSKHEYINAFGTDGWRDSVRTSVNGNRDYLFPPDPEPQQSESPQPQPQPAQRQTQPPQPAPSPHTPMPPTSTEFVQHVVAGLQTGSLPATPHVQPAPPNHQAAETPVNCHSERAETPVNCHSERSDERPTSGVPSLIGRNPLFPHPAPATRHSSLITRHFPQLKDHRLCRLPNFALPPTTPPATLSVTKGSCLHPAVPSTNQTHPIPANQFARSIASTAQPDNPPRTDPSIPQSAPNRDASALHFDHNYRLRIDGKPF